MVRSRGLTGGPKRCIVQLNMVTITEDKQKTKKKHAPLSIGCSNYSWFGLWPKQEKTTTIIASYKKFGVAAKNKSCLVKRQNVLQLCSYYFCVQVL